MTTRPSGAAKHVNNVILLLTVAVGIVGLISLITLATTLPRSSDAVAFLVYGATLMTCALFSCLYNMMERARRRALLRYLDHAGIFLLIAGTYTPFAVHGFRSDSGLFILNCVWALAVLGIIGKAVLSPAWDRLFVLFYLAIGWFFVVGFNELVSVLPTSALVLLAVGGIAYTVGALIFLRDVGRWTDPVWHGFVLTGTVTHLAAVLALAPG